MATTGRAAPLSPDLRREALIASTLPLLREYGDAVTTRQIAHACGIAEGTIFRAFPDKESLITAALDKALDPTDTIAEIAGIDPTLPLEPRLRAAAAILYERLTGAFALLGGMRLTQPPAQQPNASCESNHHHRHKARHAGVIDAVADLLRPDEQQLRRTPAEVAELLRALIFSGAHPLISAEAPLSSDEVVSILLHGVRRTRHREIDKDDRC